MSNAYTLWERGTDVATGKIVSMTPIPPEQVASHSLSAASLPIAAGSLALSAVAQFGQYLEQRKANEIRAAEFEERRHDWLGGLLDEWVAEHTDSFGIQQDITEALALECEKLLEQLLDKKKMDMPQLLLLRVERVSRFLEANFRLLARAKNELVSQSGSSREWLTDDTLNVKKVSLDIINEDAAEEKASARKLAGKSLFGLPLFFVPIAGPALGGGALGVALGSLSTLVGSPKIERAKEYLPLMQVMIAATLLEEEAGELKHLLDHQRWEDGHQVAISQRSPQSADLLLPSKTTGRWPRRKSVPETMTPVPFPDVEEPI